MSNVMLGGTRRDGRSWAFYETNGCGMGARPTSDGIDAIQCHMTNTLNTPIEAIEREYPLRVDALRNCRRHRRRRPLSRRQRADTLAGARRRFGHAHATRRPAHAGAAGRARRRIGRLRTARLYSAAATRNGTRRQDEPASRAGRHSHRANAGRRRLRGARKGALLLAAAWRSRPKRAATRRSTIRIALRRGEKRRRASAATTLP